MDVEEEEEEGADVSVTLVELRDFEGDFKASADGVIVMLPKKGVGKGERLCLKYTLYTREGGGWGRGERTGGAVANLVRAA